MARATARQRAIGQGDGTCDGDWPKQTVRRAAVRGRISWGRCGTNPNCFVFARGILPAELTGPALGPLTVESIRSR